MSDSIKELENPVSDQFLEIKKIVNDSWRFPWFYEKNDGESGESKFPFYSHTVLARPQTEQSDSSIESPLFDLTKNVLFEIFTHNKITCKKIYRININSTFPINQEISTPHVDHTFPHKNMIIHLSDNEGNTVIFKEKYGTNYHTNITSIEKCNIMCEVVPKENKIFSFDGLNYHAQRYPKKCGSRRIILVATYD